ncbi:MAG: beta-glucuronidase [Balneolales bacterium]|nr:beta-glucuronidase [Balneolales bacterium]
MLYPQQNKYRSVFDLGGYWNIKADPEDEGLSQSWFEDALDGDVHTIAIPGSWNEQLEEQGFKNYVGKAWHETWFTIPEVMQNNHRVWIRVGAADHRATVWVNGTYIGEHVGGYVPFEFDVTDALIEAGEPNHLVLCVDSTLSMHTLPQDVDPNSPMYDTPAYQRRHLYPATRFDFFPYGGLTRSVNLVITPREYISSISIDSALEGKVDVKVQAPVFHKLRVQVLDADSAILCESESETANEFNLKIENPRLWSPSDPYLYKARVSLYVNSVIVDEYDEEFGIREIKVEGGKVLFNNEELFLAGFGKHEEFPIIGRGQFRPAYIKDHELMRWIGANSYRTSHYPYDEEMMRLGDRLGFLIIDEVAAVSLGFWSNNFEDLKPLLDTHKQAIKELIERDRNHPSVISWSITNEPNLWAEEFYQNEAGKQYFKELYDFTKTLDSTRPVISISMAMFKEEDIVLESCDIIGINRYYGWYTKPVDLDQAAQDLANELEATFQKYGKPILITEFGADTVEGLHSTTAQMFTEEFQTAFTFKYLEVMEACDFVCGAHIWNFADFLTPQHFRRVVWHKKGTFTRDRFPKSVAFKLREHWNTFEKIKDTHRPAKPREGFLVPDIKKPIKKGVEYS